MRMRRNLVLMCVALTAAWGQSRAQEERYTDLRGTPVPAAMLRTISVEADSVPLREVLARIAEQGGFHLNYSGRVVPEDLFVSVRADSPAVAVLLRVLEGTGIGFLLSRGGQIVLVKTTGRSAGGDPTISGYVTDASTGEVLAGTNVYVREMGVGCSANEYGFYSLTLPADAYSLEYRFIGYDPETVSFILTEDERRDVELDMVPIRGEIVRVTGSPRQDHVRSTEMGTVHLGGRMMGALPVLGGEPDLFRTLQLLPGVIGAREGDSGFFVRGGNSDQNLILLDEAPIHNAFHVLGTFSTFNPDAVKSMTLYKGIAPSKFGGKCSSVLDVYMNEGNLKEWRVDGGVGLVFSRLTVQGPVVRDRASFMLSGRRTYLDFLLNLSENEEVRNSILYFYDLNLKANARLGRRDRLYVSGYSGRDRLGIRVDTGQDEVGFRWGNQTGTVRWNHVFSDRLFSNTSFIVSDFRYGIYVTEIPEDVRVSSEMTDLTFKEDLEFFMDARNTLRFGIRFLHHIYKPADATVTGEDDVAMLIGQRKAREWVFYASHGYASPRVRVEAGVRYSRYSVGGRADRIDFDAMEDIPAEFYDLALHAEEDAYYVGLEPRVSLTYLFSPERSVKLGYARNIQNVHMLTSTVSGTPLNTWHPSSRTVKPQVADQVSLGYFLESARGLELSLELFYKDLKHQMDYKDGADIVLMNFFESEAVFGRGWAYGAEFFLRKRFGRFTGWIGYALSRSMRRFEEINDGRPFPALSDRLHDIKVVGVYPLNERWTLSFDWMYQTGAPVTVPYGKYTVYGQTLQLYTDRNGYRMPPYHRLDIGLTYRTRRSGSWHFMLYNAYARKNVYTYLYREAEGPGNVDARQLSLFSILPSVSYQFSF